MHSRRTRTGLEKRLPSGLLLAFVVLAREIRLARPTSATQTRTFLMRERERRPRTPCSVFDENRKWDHADGMFDTFRPPLLLSHFLLSSLCSRTAGLNGNALTSFVGSLDAYPRRCSARSAEIPRGVSAGGGGGREGGGIPAGADAH